MFDILTGEKNKILRTPAERVEKFDATLQKLITQMQETMEAPDPNTGVTGVGLAANQVGILKRVILVTFGMSTSKKKKIVAMVNPEILEVSKTLVSMEEGCLSIPGIYKKVTRPAKIRVRWQNAEGNACEKRLEKWDARIFQHEHDHLDGILFTDYLKK